MTAATPTQGELVRVRGQHWVVTDVHQPPDDRQCTLVELQSVSDGGYGQRLKVIWEIEPGGKVLATQTLPKVAADRFDPPRRLAAFVDALRWSAVTSADTSVLQAPFRSGVKIEDYQLEPVARALRAPRVNLLIADDVGLGKTIEAGLVAQELLLRHRARGVMIVCPAGLTVKWRDEMAEKFGLDFVTVDTERLRELRRTHGLAANPFRVYPLTIVSLPWLRGQRAQRLLDEVLPGDGPRYPRTFDLLILDEAHHVAPAAPKQQYAVDSLQTKVVRRLAQHFEHRLFLSATPHNGYTESFTALLEMLDPQRFARGVPPDLSAQSQVVVRRLKNTIVDADHTRRFPERMASTIEVDYPDHERAAHGWLVEYTDLRRKRFGNRQAALRAADLVTLLLKKRLFSSPAAFANTVSVHLESMRSRTAVGREVDDVPEWLDDWFDDATLDDNESVQAEENVLGDALRLQPPPTPEEIDLLERMEHWARTHAARLDAKARALLDHLAGVCRRGPRWTDQRVVIFTEYRDTQNWLATLLEQAGLGGEYLALLHGGVSIEDREQLRMAFQAHPADDPVRILLATDAASEGIDLQRHCHRLVNYDIPFNPNKLEQRIGRIDRYGQTQRPDIRHFVGVGWQQAHPGSYERDLEFLSRVAVKVARMEADLGQVNAVLATAVQQRMLGRLSEDFDVHNAVGATLADRRRQPRGNVAAEPNVPDQVVRLRRQLDETAKALHVAPSNIEQVVVTALELANQQPLRPVRDHATPELFDRSDTAGRFVVPTLTGSWAKAAEGLAYRLENKKGQDRPVTFDPEIADGRDDVVLAHLGHPLTAMSTRLLRAAMWGGTSNLHRITAVVVDDDKMEASVLAAFARLVLVGLDGSQLHEEIIWAGGWLRGSDKEGFRFARIDGVDLLGGILDRALGCATPAAGSSVIRERCVAAWETIHNGLERAITTRAQTRHDSLLRAVEKRRDEETSRITATLDQFAASLRVALATDTEMGQLELPLAELQQSQRDRREWERRLARVTQERDQEIAVIHDRYRVVRHHVFPAAIVFVVPEWEASR